MITVKEMKELEDNSEKKGISKLVLMERAGKGIADEIRKRFSKDKLILFICYHGNNGGDGFTAARYLLEDGYDTKVLFIGDREKLAKEARANFEKLNADVFVEKFFIADMVVDCILGIGAVGELKEPIKGYVEEMNKSDAFIVSVDMPTGLDSEAAVEADLVITMHDIKPGLDEKKTVIVDIGI